MFVRTARGSGDDADRSALRLMYALEIVLPDRRRIAVVDEVTIGRSDRSVVHLTDPSVSRVHAVISARADGAAVLADAGSSYGTWLDGQRVLTPMPVRAGSRI